MTTGKQIRAARMLVDWDAEDLAAKTGVTRETVFNIERGIFRPRPATLEKIVRAFKDGGVEFDGDHGIRIISDDYRVLEGDDCYLRLLDEIYYATRKIEGAEVLFFSVDDALSPPEVIVAINRLLNAGVKCRFLCTEESVKFDYPIETYRQIPREYYKNSVMVVFNDKVATARNKHIKALVVKDVEQAEMMRGLFEFIWKGSPMPKGAAGQGIAKIKP